MLTYYCGQKGCEFESEKAPELCPVCGNPFIPHPNKETINKEPDADDTAIESVPGTDI